MENEKAELNLFKSKLWAVIRAVTLVLLIIWILKEVFNVLLLLLAGTLVAMYFRGLAGMIHRATKWKEGSTLAISIVGSLLLLFGFIYIAGSNIQQQVQELQRVIPPALENAREQLNKSSIGRSIVDMVESGDNRERLMAVAQSFFRSTFGILGDIYIVLFLAIFLTVSPKPYRHGFLALFPYKDKPEARRVLDKVGYTLKRWLKGQIFAMFAVFIMTAIGLVIMGVPMWLVLALSAGLLNFIPNLGPLIAMIPAVLIGFLQSPTTAIIIAILYCTVQVLESSLITPQIQKKMTRVPPALIIVAQLLMGVLTGGWGLLLAMPLMVMVIVLVQELYVKKLTYHEEAAEKKEN